VCVCVSYSQCFDFIKRESTGRHMERSTLDPNRLEPEIFSRATVMTSRDCPVCSSVSFLVTVMFYELKGSFWVASVKCYLLCSRTIPR